MAYCQDYYWYKGNKLPLKRGNQHYILYQEKGVKKLLFSNYRSRRNDLLSRQDTKSRNNYSTLRYR